MAENSAILYTSYDGMTDALGQSQVLPYLTGLSKDYGYAFHLISCEKPIRFSESKAKIQEITSAAGISWHPMSYTKKPPILSTVYDLIRMYLLADKIVKQHAVKMVHSRSIVSAIVGYKIAKKYGLKFIYDMRGFYADERVDGNLWNLKNPLYKWIYTYFKKWETKCINESDYAVCLTHAGKSALYHWKDVRPDAKIAVIPCCSDLALFNPEKTDAKKAQAYKQALGIAEHSVVMSYLGSLGTWYLLDEMLLYFKSFLAKNPDAVFLFINKDDRNYIENRADYFGIKDKLRIQSAPREEVPVLLSLSKYAIFFIKPSYSKIASSPTKQGEIMAMGIPIICNDGVGDTSAIIRKYQAGEVVSDVNKTDYSEEVISLDETTFDISRIKQGAEDVFSLKQGVAQYAELYAVVLKNE